MVSRRMARPFRCKPIPSQPTLPAQVKWWRIGPIRFPLIGQAYQGWYTSALAAGGDLPQAAWSSETITVTLIMQDEASATAAKELFPTLNIQLLDSYAEWLV